MAISKKGKQAQRNPKAGAKESRKGRSFVKKPSAPSKLSTPAAKLVQQIAQLTQAFHQTVNILMKRAGLDPIPNQVPCSCPDMCAGVASGGVWTCEDGVSTYIPKPSYYAVLVNDPNVPLPYWERPANI